MRIFAVMCALALCSAPAFAQQAASPKAPADKASYMSAPDLAAAIADIKGNLTIMSLYLPNPK